MEGLIKEAYNDLENIKKLFTEYTQSLGIDLTYQNYTLEYSSLPGKYSSPGGRLYIAYLNNEAAGCIAMRKINDNDCEIKRLYVKEEARGYQLGQRLVEKLTNEAKKDAYYETPVQNTVFMKLNLQ